MLDGKERRRRARETRIRHSSEIQPPPLADTTLRDDGTRPLALAGMVLATADLDRLSSMARSTRGRAMSTV